MESSFGMQRVLDQKTDEFGRVFYKVQWEPTWEPAESLAGCQKLIDEFWSSLNKPATQVKSEVKLKRSSSEIKRDNQKVAVLEVPSDMAINSYTQSLLNPLIPKNKGIIREDSVKQESLDSDVDSLRAGGASNVSSKQGWQYIESFDNPYVKIVLVCKICNKEQSSKCAGNWKKHYLTHASDEEKPHKCVVCGKAFIQHNAMTKHMKTHTGFGVKVE